MRTGLYEVRENLLIRRTGIRQALEQHKRTGNALQVARAISRLTELNHAIAEMTAAIKGKPRPKVHAPRVRWDGRDHKGNKGT